MISLREMDEDQFSGYREYFIADYAIEVEENYKKSREQALKIAAQELKDDLPEGVRTKNNVLLCLYLAEGRDQRLVGYLWYKRNLVEASIFVYDFYVFPQDRSLGYGKESMALLEERLRREGVGQIKLRVAHKNVKALALYQEMGFEITGINMAKSLGEYEES
jgi:ribosomal protein S18 acetylase RimI-like enzyme